MLKVFTCVDVFNEEYLWVLVIARSHDPVKRCSVHAGLTGTCLAQGNAEKTAARGRPLSLACLVCFESTFIEAAPVQRAYLTA